VSDLSVRVSERDKTSCMALYSPVEALTGQIPQTISQQSTALVAALVKEFDQEPPPSGVMHHVMEPARDSCVFVDQSISDVLP
jgi:hypothetical protein